MCLYSDCCRRMFPLYHHSCGLAQPLLFPAFQHSVSQHLFQLLPQFEEAPAPSPLSSSGQSGQDIHCRIFTSSSTTSNQGHTEAGRETSAWVLLKFGMFSCAATLLYPAGSSPPSPAPALSLLNGLHQTL